MSFHQLGISEAKEAHGTVIETRLDYEIRTTSAEMSAKSSPSRLLSVRQASRDAKMHEGESKGENNRVSVDQYVNDLRG
jgi:hypothetical protein